MDTLIIPEIILLDAYQKALDFIRSNYIANKSQPEKSYLGILLGNQNLERYEFLEQSRSVFITTNKDPRHILVNLFFNAQRATIPTIHITNPSEIPIHDALNLSQGFREPDFDEDEQTYTPVFNRRFKAKYNIVFTSDNINEVVFVYQIMKSMSISITEHLNLSGLENIKISGNEISLKSDIIPSNIFIKAIGIEFEYDVIAVKLSTIDYSLGNFVPKGTPIQE